MGGSPSTSSRICRRYEHESSPVAGVYASKSNTTFISFGKAYPHRTFSAVISSSASGRFKDPQKWDGKVMTVTGTIKLDEGKPEMVLESPSQVCE